MNCKNCGRPCVKKTHDKPKLGKTRWYAWWFVCKPCKWYYMPPEAKREIEETRWKEDDYHSAWKCGPPQIIGAPTNAYLHQDPGDDGIPPFDCDCCR